MECHYPLYTAVIFRNETMCRFISYFMSLLVCPLLAFRVGRIYGTMYSMFQTSIGNASLKIRRDIVTISAINISSAVSISKTMAIISVNRSFTTKRLCARRHIFLFSQSLHFSIYLLFVCSSKCFAYNWKTNNQIHTVLKRLLLIRLVASKCMTPTSLRVYVFFSPVSYHCARSRPTVYIIRCTRAPRRALNMSRFVFLYVC